MNPTSPRRNTVSSDARALANQEHTLSESVAAATTRTKKSVSFDLPVRPSIFNRPLQQRSLASPFSKINTDQSEARHCSPRPGKENYVFQMPEKVLQKKLEEISQTQAKSATEKTEAALRSPRLVVRSSVPSLTSQSAPVSMVNSPTSTPRTSANAETQAGENNSPHENSLKKIGREISATLESISPRLKSSISKAWIGSSSTEKVITNPLLVLSEELLDKLEQKIRELKNNPQFQPKPAYQKNIILNAEIMQNLPTENEFHDPDKLKLLLAELNERIANAEHGIDREVDLKDPAFLKFINDAAHAAFQLPWIKDSSNVDEELQCYLDELKPTFLRDFRHSDFIFKDENGKERKLTDPKEFIALMRSDNHPQFPMLISNIASQNLANFLKNSLFLRQDANGKSQSILKSRDGTPLLPLANVRSSYVFSRNKDGSVTIHYTWASSREINGAKELRVKKWNDTQDSFSVKNASLEIKVAINIQSESEWTIFNPHVKAKGWT